MTLYVTGLLYRSLWPLTECPVRVLGRRSVKCGNRKIGGRYPVFPVVDLYVEDEGLWQLPHSGESGIVKRNVVVGSSPYLRLDTIQEREEFYVDGCRNQVRG